MKAIRVHAPGGPEALRYEDVPQPTPGAGQVVVRIEAAGVNFIDLTIAPGCTRRRCLSRWGKKQPGP